MNLDQSADKITPSSGTLTVAGTESVTALNITGTTDQISSVAVSSNPSAPSAGNLKTFATTIAGNTLPAFLNPTNAYVALQPAWANKRIGIFTTNQTLSPTNFGMGSFSVTGAASSFSNSTNMFSRATKMGLTSSATAGSFAQLYQSSPLTYSLGTATTPALGGFYYTIKFGISDTVANPRTFIGLGGVTSAPTNVEPSTLLNSIGIGQGSADTNFKIYYGGSAAQTPIDLGANFPSNTNAVDWYEFTLYAPPTSNNTVYYQVVRLNTGNVASGTLTGTAGTALPSNSSLLALRNWRTNNATSAAVTWCLGAIYTETDY